MARLFRLWGKKRGHRRTGSKLVGSLGEAVFFAVLFILGVVSLTSLITTYVLRPQPEVLVLGSGYGFWLLVLVFGSFIAIGAGGLILSVFQVGTSEERRSALARRATSIELISEALHEPKDFPAIPSDVNQTNSPGIQLKYRLPMSQMSVWALVAMSIFCVLWALIAVMLTVVVLKTPLTDLSSYALAAFSIPVVAIAVWSMNHLRKQLRIQTGIGPTSVEISEHPLRVSKEYEVFVSQAGRLHLNQFEVALVCEEEATYSQGTDVRTERRIVFQETIFLEKDFSIDPSIEFSHRCRLRIPDCMMHSFQGANNGVSWQIRVSARGQAWRRFDRQFPIVVYPQFDSGASHD